MTELLERPATTTERSTIEKVSIVVSKGSLEGIYPGLIMANGARMEGIDADLFFTFFGLDAIRRDRVRHIKVATVGNPGMHMPTLVGALPGFSAIATRMMQRQMEKLDIPPIPEFVELLADSGAGLYACKASVEMFGLTIDDFVPQVRDIIAVGQFYEHAAGGKSGFTEPPSSCSTPADDVGNSNAVARVVNSSYPAHATNDTREVVELPQVSP